MLDDFMTGFPASISGGVAGMLAALRHRVSLSTVLEGISSAASAGSSQHQNAATDSTSGSSMGALPSSKLILKIENVTLLDRLTGQRQVEGTLCVTATHLIFIDATCSKECWVPHCHVQSMEKLQSVSYGTPLRIRCKTFRALTLVIPRERDCADVVLAISKLAQPERIEDLLAFTFTHPSVTIPKTSGWNSFDVRADFERMGLPNENWIFTDLNVNYELCDTYPSCICVPTTATTPVILGSSRFRSRGRLPALSYLHKRNQAALCRCSQPLAGFSARCSEDEQMLQAILKVNPRSDALVVVDTRPKINALANRAAGKGYENERVYTNIKFHFVGIENVHVMRNSLQKLIDCTDSSSSTSASFLSGLEACGWLKHIRAIVETSVFIANNLESNNSVLVHCSDGWDRTAQTCSLAAILLDPYYRTIEGFQMLVEKEWLAFGHKFTDRCRLIGAVDAKEESPIFTQFLEAVWQLTNQFPCSFQFNERFLIEMHTSMFSCEYGTFIGNCEKDRKDLRLSERTYSLWAYIASNTDHYLNPFYHSSSDGQDAILRPNVGPQCFRYWKGMYNRYDTAVHEKESVTAISMTLREQNSMLEGHVQHLEKRAQELARALGRPLVSALSHKLQGLLSAESISCLASLAMNDNVSESAPMRRKRTRPRSLGEQSETATNGEKPDEAAFDDRSADDDEESGFEDGVSPQMSRSRLLDADGRPLNAGAGTPSGKSDSTVNLIGVDVCDIALGWSSLRDQQQCRGCSSPFDYTSAKRHCRGCGHVFCCRCTDRRLLLAGMGVHASAAPVCKPCHKTRTAATAARQRSSVTFMSSDGGGGGGEHM